MARPTTSTASFDALAALYAETRRELMARGVAAICRTSPTRGDQ
jgi:hypothetical protein